MTETKTFHVGYVLTAMTGILVSPRHVEGVYDILNWLSGEESLMTHQLPRVSREAEPFLRQLFPDLADIKIPKFSGSKDQVLAWLDRIVAQYGETREVPRMSPEDHTHIDPIAEIKMIRPDLPIIAIGDSGEEQP